MFDRLFAGAEEPALLAAIEQCAREEAQAGARKAAAIAELVYSTVDRDDEHDDWVYDCWAQTASELGAVLNLGHRRASGQMRIAMALRDRLPGLAERYLQGRVSAQVVSKICWRTRLVVDTQVWALLDEQLATHAPQWGSLSEEALVRAIDAVIDRYDPDALIRSKEVIAAAIFISGPTRIPMNGCWCGVRSWAVMPCCWRPGSLSCSRTCVPMIRATWGSGGHVRWGRSSDARTTCRAGAAKRTARALRRWLRAARMW